MDIGKTRFYGGVVLENELLGKIEDKLLLTISQELPEEAQVYEVFLYILEKSEKRLQCKKLSL